MRLKRTSQRTNNDSASPSKQSKICSGIDYFKITLEECGLQINEHPEKSFMSHEIGVILRNLKRKLQKHTDYPRNVSEFLTNFENRCQDNTVFKHYLFPHVVRKSNENVESGTVACSLIKILLNVPILQNKLIDFILSKATDLAVDSQCGPWIQMILKCFTTLDNIIDSANIAVKLIDLLDVASENIVRLEIITAIPDIIGDQVHDNIAREMSRIMSEQHDLIPAILDCLSYLCLSEEQYEKLQKTALSILMTLPKCNNFANFVKFLLLPRQVSDNVYLEVVQGLRKALCWSSSIDKPEDAVSSQIFTANAIRSSIVVSKVIGNAWLKSITMCKLSTDHKPIDIVIIIILYSASEEKQKLIENVIRKQIKSNILNEELLDESFDLFKPIIKEYIRPLITLTNSLLKSKTEPVIQSFASHIYTLMLSKLEVLCQSLVAELLQLSLDCQHCVIDIMSILNDVALKDMSILKPQSVQMLTLLDRMDDMTLYEIRAVMNLICGLAYSYENSVIRDDINMIIRKELVSSNPKIKVQGILAGLHAVKYLMKSKDDIDQSIHITENVICSLETMLPKGDVQEAAEMIELVSNSTRKFPDMFALFYDELCKIMQSSSYINKHFLHWITEAVTNDLSKNFIVKIESYPTIQDDKHDIQYCLNTDSEINEAIAVNIGGIIGDFKEDVNIMTLTPLFQLVQILHVKEYGDLSQIEALLGCPVVMPIFNINLIDDITVNELSHILNCQIHCANWFRELVNSFSSVNDSYLKTKVFSRISHIRQLENIINQILLKNGCSYKPPTQILGIIRNSDDFTRSTSKRQTVPRKNSKKVTPEDSHIHENLKSSLTYNNMVNDKQRHMQNINLKNLSLNVLNLLNDELSKEDEEPGLCIENLFFLLKSINNNLENVLISKYKRNTFFAKQSIPEIDNKLKVEECAKSISNVLPKLIDHMKSIISHIDQHFNEEEEIDGDYMLTDKILIYILTLEYIFNTFTTFFNWIGFKIQHKDLLTSSLRSIACSGDEVPTLQKFLQSVSKHFQRYQKYCIQLPTAISLIEVISALQKHSLNSDVTIILKDMAKHFLSKDWKTASGIAEKGLIFNQSIDHLLRLYLLDVEVSDVKNIVLLLVNDVKLLNNQNSTLTSFKSIRKNNFHVFYKNLGSAIHESSKTYLAKGLTNLECLNFWKDVVFILKCMADIAVSLKMRTVISSFFIKALPIIRLFLQEGIPILEIEFKNKSQRIIDILGTLQHSTKFLQTLCRHFRLKKDKAMLTKVPFMKHILEKLLYKVKVILAANNSSEAFCLGILKNRNIDGKVIATQETVITEDTVEDSDSQLPDDSTETIDEAFDPESNSESDMV